MSIVMDRYDALEEEQNLRFFSLTFAASQFLGALSVILVAIWMGKWSGGGGFAWTEDPDKEFNYHPLFMTIGLIFLQGEAILIYRVFRHEKKSFTKAIHVALHSLVFVFFVVALKAVFDSHNLAVDKQGNPSPHANLFSIHSWIGLSTCIIFCCQYVCGFVSYFFPGLSLPVRQWYMPIHRFFGVSLFIFAVIAALMGISERAAFHSVASWANFQPEGWVINMLGLSIFLYGFSVVYLVVNPRFRRRALPEEESLQQLHTTD